MSRTVVFESAFQNGTYDVEYDVNATQLEEIETVSNVTIACLSALFFAIGIVGIAGNLLVILAILSDHRMRRSATNLLITNLAFSDLIIMLVCVPEIVQFMQNKGWRLGLPFCRIVRFLEVSALYVSVMTLVGVCVERYVAIIHPMQAHITCSRSRILLVIVLTWSLSMICASPNLLFHVVLRLQLDFTPCVLQFPGTVFYKYAEFFVFYLIPLVLQVTLYVRIGRKLFHPSIECQTVAVSREKFVSTTRSRRGVVKMLMFGVGVYFVSFSPHQVLLVYNTFSPRRFRETWSYLIFVNIMAYSSSACNPLLYSIFSHNFRRHFKTVLSRCVKCSPPSSRSSEDVHTRQCSSIKRRPAKNFGTSVSEV